MTARCRLRRLRSWAAAAAVVLATCGCGVFDEGAHYLDTGLEERVAADPAATPPEIVAVGGPTAVASHAGATLVAWVAEDDTSEGPKQGAWRLYDREWRAVAEGALGQIREASAQPLLLTTSDGFLVAGYTGPRLRHLAVDGTLTDVPISPIRTPTRPGDVLVRRIMPEESLVVYRPSEHRAFRLPKPPFPELQQIAMDRTGRVWVQQLWSDRTAPVSSSADGTEAWTRTEVPLAAGGQPQSLVVVRGKVVMNTAVDTGELPALDALWTRPVGGSPSAPWRRVDTSGIQLSDTDVDLGALPNGRLVVAGGNQEMFLQDADGTFSRLSPPDGMLSSSLQPAGNGLYLVGSPDNQLYRFVDGSSWETVQR